MSHLLSLENFHYSYGNIHVVKGIDLYVDEGEIVTLIGANGAGKTTTMRAVSGLLNPKGIDGEVIFNGKHIEKMNGHRVTKQGLAQVIEGRRIFSKLTVEENLMMGAYLRKDRANVKKDLSEIYERFPRLLERRQQMGGTLSGGEQQMLAIGRALISKPKMMLLDEPSLGLAPIIVKEIFEIIKNIREDGTTILFVEQNSKIALSTADRGYVLQNGEITISGNCSSLLNNDEVKAAYLGVT